MTWIAEAVKGSNEYDAIMRQAVSIGLQEAAGYAPKVLTKDDGLPQLIYAQNEICGATDDSYQWRLGDIVYIIVDVRICTNCRYHLNMAFDTIYFRYAASSVDLTPRRCECRDVTACGSYAASVSDSYSAMDIVP